MVALDPLGQVGEVDLERGLHRPVLVLRVRDEEPGHGADVAGQGDACATVGRVEATSLGHDGEQLGADALVDIAVQIVHHELELGAAGLLGDGLLGDGHWGGPFDEVCLPRTIVKECNRRRSSMRRSRMLRIRSQLRKESPRPVFEPETVEFLESGCALIVGTVDAHGAPHATRGWSAKVLDAGEARLRLGLDALDSTVLDNLQETGRIAVTGADVRTLRSAQMKGRAGDLVPADDLDRERIARYCDAFYTDVYESDGTPRPLLDRLTPADFVMCEVTVDEYYDQTPGPAAGNELASRRR